MMTLPSRRLSKLRVRHLALLEIIAESGSLRKAADILFVTQPAVTAMLQELESTLGTQVVDRNRQGVRLTKAGAVALERLRLVLYALNGVEASLLASPPKPHLRIGVLSLAMLKLVPRAIETLRQEGSDITFEFVEGTVEEIISGVMNGNFDCAVGRMSSQFGAAQPAELEHEVICDVRMKIVCAKNNPMSKVSTVTLEELQHKAWILLPRGTESREAFERAFTQQGLIAPFPALESMSFVSNFHIAAMGDLLTISTATAVDIYAGYGTVSPVNIIWPVSLSPLVFFARKDAMQLESVRTFRRSIRMHSETSL